MKRIGVVTTSRADYGLYYPILKKIKADPALELVLFVSGMHLSPEYGHTIDFIKQDGFTVSSQVDMLLSDSAADIARSMGKGTMGFADVYEKHQLDFLLVLGDRFEMHAAAVAAVPFGIPLGHIHGGELTGGAFDEFFRHSLTKLCHLHFASTKVYAQRIIQMGEHPSRVFVTGAPGLDNILNAEIYSPEQLSGKFGFDVEKPVILVTFHPVTMEKEHTESYIISLLDALAAFSECSLVFTQPNADTNSQVILQNVKKFLTQHKNASLVENFGQKGYLSMMKHAAVMVGNSSSGIIEAASYKLPVVNIGTRQEGRLRAANVIDVGYQAKDIEGFIKKALQPKFRETLKDLINPYGDGLASDRIVSILKKADFTKLKQKMFYDLEQRDE